MRSGQSMASGQRSASGGEHGGLMGPSGSGRSGGMSMNFDVSAFTLLD